MRDGTGFGLCEAVEPAGAGEDTAADAEGDGVAADAEGVAVADAVAGTVVNVAAEAGPIVVSPSIRVPNPVTAIRALRDGIFSLLKIWRDDYPDCVLEVI